MTHVFDRVRGARKAPEDFVLKRMKNLWELYQPDIDHITAFTWPQDQNSPRFRLARKTRDWAQLCMQNAVWVREDYMELLELIAAYLGLPILHMDSQQYSSFVVWVQSIMQDSWLRP